MRSAVTVLGILSVVMLPMAAIAQNEAEPQDPVPTTEPMVPSPSFEVAMGEDDASKVEGPTQEMGARLGLDVGGRISPGGLLISGTYLYRFSDVDWLDQSIGVTFGGQGAACFRDRQNELLCDHHILEGFAIDVSVGIRRYLVSSSEFSPYVRAGVALRGVFYSADDVRGFAVPVFAGGGIRARVAPRVAVVADATIRTGFAFFNRGLGVEPHAGFAVQGGVEFILD